MNHPSDVESYQDGTLTASPFGVVARVRRPIPVIPFSATGMFLKRVLDLLIALPSLVLLSPLLALVAIAVKLDSRGPVFYKSVRVGYQGAIFTCYKFRSMVLNADQLKSRLRRKNERKGATFKIADDPRITRFGSFIRRYSVDELPQIWNVIAGDMSIVGPRPHDIDDVLRYSPENWLRCVVKPGLTCLWQIRARRDPSFELNMRLDREYIRRRSLILDLKIILATVAVVLRGEGQ